MTLVELVNSEKHKVRNDESLMLFYLESFEKQFGRKPNCAGCTFNFDWEKFKQKVKANNLKPITMSKQTFELHKKHSNDIFTYVEKKRPYRTYGNKMTEDFAEKLLNIGTKEQIEERKKAFKKLPKAETKKPEEKAETKKAETKKVEPKAETKK